MIEQIDERTEIPFSFRHETSQKSFRIMLEGRWCSLSKTSRMVMSREHLSIQKPEGPLG